MAATGAILVVDDQQNDVDLLLRTFKKLKVANRIDVCMSADQAIQYLTTRELPAVMLLDLKMPEKDGFFVLRRIKTDPALRDLVVIVLTTSDDLREIQLAYELGANSFLTKPLHMDEFREMIKAFHKYWIIHAQPTPKRGKLMDKPDAA